jgi:hypothetical protein
MLEIDLHRDFGLMSSSLYRRSGDDDFAQARALGESYANHFRKGCTHPLGLCLPQRSFRVVGGEETTGNL